MYTSNHFFLIRAKCKQNYQQHNKARGNCAKEFFTVKYISKMLNKVQYCKLRYFVKNYSILFFENCDIRDYIPLCYRGYMSPQDNKTADSKEFADKASYSISEVDNSAILRHLALDYANLDTILNSISNTGEKIQKLKETSMFKRSTLEELYQELKSIESEFEDMYQALSYRVDRLLQ